MEGASGVALDTYIDKNSARFVDVQQAYEEWHVDIARRACELLEELAADDRDYEVVHVSGKTVERVSWRDLRLSEPYVLQVWPTSLFPSTPAGKLKRLQELMESGIAQALGMDATTIQRLMNVPDLEAENLSSPRDAIDKLIERMITDEDETVTPDPVLPLDVCLSVAQRRYAYGLAEGMEEPKLELLRRWMAACTSLMRRLGHPSPPRQPLRLRTPRPRRLMRAACHLTRCRLAPEEWSSDLPHRPRHVHAYSAGVPWVGRTGAAGAPLGAVEPPEREAQDHPHRGPDGPGLSGEPQPRAVQVAAPLHV
jgi:hypothetical protein